MENLDLSKIKKFFYKIIHPILKYYWFVFRPKTRGVKCLIENNGKFLLVKLNYAHHKWTIPGGGVKRGESFLGAAIRETKEETGIEIFEPIFIGSYTGIIEYKNDSVEVYLAHSHDIVYKIDPVEIKEAKWFSVNELPNDRAASVDRIFKFYEEFKFGKN